MPEEGVLELTERVEQAGGTDQKSSEEQEIDAILASVTEADQGRSGGGAGGLVSPKTDSAVTSTLSDFAGALMREKAESEAAGGPTQTLDTLVRMALEPTPAERLAEARRSSRARRTCNRRLCGGAPHRS